MKSDTRQNLIIAALLHDIGKFAQRAEMELSREYKNMKHLCCKLTQHKTYSHSHVLWSGQFCKNHLFTFPSVENIVLYHHLPENASEDFPYLAKIVTLADWLSSGERCEREDEEEYGNPKKEPILSIFSNIRINDESNGDSPLFHPLIALPQDISQTYPCIKEKALSKHSYSKLWGEFISEWNRIDFEQEFDQILSQIYYLLQKFTLFIPSSTYKDKPDVSLFHHSKTTAAIASGIYNLDLPESQIDRMLKDFKKKENDENENPIFYLLKGDISGIQEFIYSITSEKALKSLKGRSLHLQLLSDAIARNILSEFNLPEMNLLLSAGGNIMILVPAIEKYYDSISKIQDRLNKTLFESNKGHLAVSFAWQSLMLKDFERERFLGVWEILGTKMSQEKKRKFSSLFNSKSINLILGPFDVGGDRKACEICGEELEKYESDKCILCESFEKLATDFSHANFMNVYAMEPLKGEYLPASPWYKILQTLGWDYHFDKSPDKKGFSYIIGETDFIEDSCSGFVFLVKHSAQKESHEIATLEDLGNSSEGISKWGVLRGDVDDLSKVFSQGLGDDKTISRYCMISSLVSLFFTARMENILQNEDFQNKVSVVYSGGDDFFLVGSWSALPLLAERISREFHDYTCRKLTLSTGIFIAPGDKFPLYQAASSSGEALESSKHSGKNRVCFLDHTLKWDEYIEFKEIKDMLVELLNNKVPRAILSVLYWASGEHERADKILKEEEEGIPIERIWRLSYSLKRMKERLGKREESIQNVNKISEIEKRIVSDYMLKPKLDVAIRWAELLTRKEGMK